MPLQGNTRIRTVERDKYKLQKLVSQCTINKYV